jgi:D-beta-D-heptose 7-phosphate kinase/D-beta-D-heptose 1-phosphate adenosyltransferase
MKMIASLEMVDYVVSFNEDTPLELIEELDPDVLVKGSEYKIEDIVGAEIVKEVYVAPMVGGISTTLLAEKIKAQV